MENKSGGLYLVNVGEINRIAYEILDYAKKENPKEFPSIKRWYNICFDTISFNIEMRRYDDLWRMIGRPFLELLVKYYAEKEEYEKCKQIIDGFNEFDAEQKRRLIEIDKKKQKGGKVDKQWIEFKLNHPEIFES